MKRTIWEITGDLVAQSPLHIGAAESGSLIDAVLVRDGLGRYLVPGTTLAGVLRARLDGDSAVWGDVEDDEATTSAVTVFDAWTGDSVAIEERTTTSIDRVTGAAAAHHLFSREYLAEGTTFRFRALIEGDAERPELEQEAIRIAALLRTGIAVGAKTSSGYGLIKSKNVEILRKSFERSRLLATLGVAGKPARVDHLKHRETQDLLVVTVPFTAAGAVFVADSRDGGEIGQLPLTASRGANTHFVIPGTSSKGALRSHAEVIARTVTDVDAPAYDPEKPSSFLDQLTSVGLHAVGDLFGRANEKADASRDATGSQDTGNSAAIRVHETLSETKIPATQWEALINAKNKQDVHSRVRNLNRQLNKSGAHLVFATRNSIDRFSGGTVDAKLFTALEPHVAWQPLTLEIDLDALTRNTADRDREKATLVPNSDRRNAALALLLFILLDMADGIPDGGLRLGADVTRGSGGLRVDRKQITLTASRGSYAERLNGSLDEVLADDDLLEELSGAWSRQIAHPGDDQKAEESHV
ncbi:MAG: RAMP superfamily CRISPR-associated protein [Gordonia sp. (in: high G+C Gram-positive bacteria)]|uniref:RAMP superfamily CRISPR-associated protein n=1 Tax=Gordonia sp. (in: high G+C Gram-positive bacteria) TaxID=84139 RepID=UPI0039E5964C